MQQPWTLHECFATQALCPERRPGSERIWKVPQIPRFGFRVYRMDASTGNEVSMYVSLLKICAKNKDLTKGSTIHADVVSRGLLQSNPYLGSSLISMYMKCGRLREALEVFHGLLRRNVVSWNALITGYAQQHSHAMSVFICFERMQTEALLPDGTTLSCLLKSCSHIQNAEKGQRIHSMIIFADILPKDVVLGNALIEMYGACGEIIEAEKVLDKLPTRNVVSWSSLIFGYVNQGKAKEALTCYERMQTEGIHPNVVTLLSALKACALLRSLDKGKHIHEEARCKGLFKGEIMLGTAVLDMYAKCGMMANAENLMDELLFPDLISWNMLISGYVQHGLDGLALSSLEFMKSQSLFPNDVTFICLLQACGRIGSITIGKKIHSEIVGNHMLPDHVTLYNGLLDMYAKCGALEHARNVLEEIPNRTLISWNTLISGYVQQGRGDEALDCFELMRTEGLFPNAITYACLLKACALKGTLQKGQEIHDDIDKKGFLNVNLALGTALVDMYAKCDDMPRAEKALLELPIRNVVTWSALIAGYSEHGEVNDAVRCFELMQREDISPDHVTFVSLLKACGDTEALTKGVEFHNTIISHGLGNDMKICSALINMYVKCGALGKARQLFDEIPMPNLASWNALMAGYILHCEGEAALCCFNIVQKQGLLLDAITFTCALKACGLTGTINRGREIQDETVHRGLINKDVILGVALIDMYAKCGAMEDAQLAFDKLFARNEISWNTLISGYAQHGQGEEALNCFELMQIEGFIPDRITFICSLKACANIGAISTGIKIHSAISQQKRYLVEDQDVMLGNALTDMYAKCGELVKAKCVFDNLPTRNVASWNVVITGYAQHGKAQEAFACFELMQEEGICPDPITFLCLLYACSHSGMVNEAEMCYVDIHQSYGLSADLDHSTCMIDLYSRSGQFKNAIQMIQVMPYDYHPPIWIALLGACRNHGDVTIGRIAFDQSIQMDSACSAAYLLMREIYRAAGMLDDAFGIDNLREKNCCVICED